MEILLQRRAHQDLGAGDELRLDQQRDAVVGQRRIVRSGVEVDVIPDLTLDRAGAPRGQRALVHLGIVDRGDRDLAHLVIATDPRCHRAGLGPVSVDGPLPAQLVEVLVDGDLAHTERLRGLLEGR